MPFGTEMKTEPQDLLEYDLGYDQNRKTGVWCGTTGWLRDTISYWDTYYIAKGFWLGLNLEVTLTYIYCT